MRLIIHDDNDALSKACAEYVMTQIRHAAPTAERPFVMAIPTGNTAKGVYKHLCSLFKAGEVSFEVRAADFKGGGRSWPGSAGFSWPAEPLRRMEWVCGEDVRRRLLLLLSLLSFPLLPCSTSHPPASPSSRLRSTPI